MSTINIMYPGINGDHTVVYMWLPWLQKSITWVKGVWFPLVTVRHRWTDLCGVVARVTALCIAGKELLLMWPKDKANGLVVYEQEVCVCVCECVSVCVRSIPTPNSINPVHLRESVLIDFSLLLLTESCVRCVCQIDWTRVIPHSDH